MALVSPLLQLPLTRTSSILKEWSAKQGAVIKPSSVVKTFSNLPDLYRLAKLLMIEMKNTLHQQLAKLRASNDSLTQELAEQVNRTDSDAINGHNFLPRKVVYGAGTSSNAPSPRNKDDLHGLIHLPGLWLHQPTPQPQVEGGGEDGPWPRCEVQFRSWIITCKCFSLWIIILSINGTVIFFHVFYNQTIARPLIKPAALPQR